MRAWQPPFNPAGATEECAAWLRGYGITRVEGDRYAGEWSREQFRAHGIHYEPSNKTKSELYSSLLPLLNSGRVSLLDNKRLAAQILGLERRTSRSGRDSIDHGLGGHDDLANAVAGAVVLAAQRAAQVTPRFWRPGLRRREGWVRLN